MQARIVMGLLGLTALSAGLGCGERKVELPTASEGVVQPYQEFDKATLVFYQGSVRKWRLESLYMRKPLGDTGTVLAVPVVLALFDSSGKARTRVMSDSGISTTSMQGFTIWGDVYVKTKDGMVVRSERLSLNNRTRRWHSDTFVEIRTGRGDVMRGKIFDASEDFAQSSFKQSVTAWIPDFRERVEKDEAFF